MNLDRRTFFAAAGWLGFAGTGAAVPAVGSATRVVGAPYEPAPDIVVARDGSGQFTSIHEALQSIPTSNRERQVVYVKNGVYDEVVRVDAAYVTLRGQSRLGVRLQNNRPADLPRDAFGPGVLNISPTAHDFVLESLTVHNTVEAIGPHAFAVMGRADRTIIQNADILSLGADTLALWRGVKSADEAGLSQGPGASPLTEDGGRYYHNDLRVIGSVDFICPRGWCYLANSEITQVNAATTAALWHEGMRVEDKKFVIRGSTIDGPPDFYLARRHRDAQFYFVDCAFTERMRDQPPYLVVYPIGGGVPTPEDLERNRQAASEARWGERHYFHDSHRRGGDYGWLADNLATAADAPRPEDVTARWTFGGSWDPERRDGPDVIQVRSGADTVTLTFDRLVTVKGAPRLDFASGPSGRYVTGSGTNTLVFERRGSADAEPASLDLSQGSIWTSEAVAVASSPVVELPHRQRHLAGQDAA